MKNRRGTLDLRPPIRVPRPGRKQGNAEDPAILAYRRERAQNRRWQIAMITVSRGVRAQRTDGGTNRQIAAPDQPESPIP